MCARRDGTGWCWTATFAIGRRGYGEENRAGDGSGNVECDGHALATLAAVTRRVIQIYEIHFTFGNRAHAHVACIAGNRLRRGGREQDAIADVGTADGAGGGADGV